MTRCRGFSITKCRKVPKKRNFVVFFLSPFVRVMETTEPSIFDPFSREQASDVEGSDGKGL